MQHDKIFLRTPGLVVVRETDNCMAKLSTVYAKKRLLRGLQVVPRIFREPESVCRRPFFEFCCAVVGKNRTNIKYCRLILICFLPSKSI
jgi:hypothetical protein